MNIIKEDTDNNFIMMIVCQVNLFTYLK